VARLRPLYCRRPEGRFAVDDDLSAKGASNMIPALLDGQDARMPQTAMPREQASACAVCPHPLDGHDAIASRFCRATVQAELERGCVCRSN
jgi:hypothetical protein